MVRTPWLRTAERLINAIYSYLGGQDLEPITTHDRPFQLTLTLHLYALFSQLRSPII